MKNEKKLERLEREIIRVQQSSGTYWPGFIKLHNWLRMHSRVYYWWHTTVLANPVHASLFTLMLGGTVLIIVTVVLILIGYVFYTNTDGVAAIFQVLRDWWPGDSA